ncbi:MAG TPA: hypothetical protein PLX85_00120 [Dehalococcoidia bacterium]|nr:hypothetical protein [Dehalococcoidia bacterium]
MSDPRQVVIDALRSGPKNYQSLRMATHLEPGAMDAALTALKRDGLVKIDMGFWELVAETPQPRKTLEVTISGPVASGDSLLEVLHAAADRDVMVTAPTDPPPTSEDHDPMASTKHCKRCDKRKPVSAFGKNATRSDGLQTYCRPCMNEATSKRKDAPARAKKVAAPVVSTNAEAESPEPENREIHCDLFFVTHRTVSAQWSGEYVAIDVRQDGVSERVVITRRELRAIAAQDLNE